ncbi:MAG TPA: hypothetical protein VKA16_02600 [Burkholderiales bacterium]|nr:hypothetical protein [Burkholderiales bacterium]
MNRILLPVVVLALAVSGCSSVENAMGRRFTVKDYSAASGERVMAGQAEPREEYGCRKVAEEKRDWGLSGNMTRPTATERVTRVAVDAAPAKGANYANIMIPSEARLMGFNLHAFSDARVAYYRCANLPPR